MNSTDIVRAIDIHAFLDKLEKESCIQNYYRINHLSGQQISTLAERMAASLLQELEAMGLSIES
ncbi:MAG: hypothetical protein PHD82_09265 [Candidatus Riflebacteria bacterium]|jgi:hypothetical protein|nr:hypothetical protein [Candidatus Riflebacteria bacterium]